MIYTGKLQHMMLYDDMSWPYTDVEILYEKFKDKYPGKCVVVNAHWHNPGPSYAGDYKVDGKILSNEAPNQYYGFKWNTGEVPVGMDTGMGEYDNFLSTIPAIIDGVRQPLNYGDSVERPARRTWIGYDANNQWTVEVTQENYTLDAIVDRMEDMGIIYGMVLDGSGASQWYDGCFAEYGDGRTLYSFLLMWFEEKTLDWETEKKLAREWVMEKGISDGERGKDNITREEMWVMLYRMWENVIIG